MSDPNRATTRCAACKGVVYADADRCKHCGAPSGVMLGDGPVAPPGPRCPHCGGRVLLHATNCKHCGRDLKP